MDSNSWIVGPNYKTSMLTSDYRCPTTSYVTSNPVGRTAEGANNKHVSCLKVFHAYYANKFHGCL